MPNQTSLAPEALMASMGTSASPRLIDVRRAEVFAASEYVIAGATWREHREAHRWGAELNSDDTIVVYCVHGEQVSLTAAAALRAQGLQAYVLEGGIEGFIAAGGVTTRRKLSVLSGLGGLGQAREAGGPTTPANNSVGGQRDRWVMPHPAGLDDFACIWLLRRFTNPLAQLHFTQPEYVEAVANELDASTLQRKPAPTRHSGCDSLRALTERFGLVTSEMQRLYTLIGDFEDESGAQTGHYASLAVAVEETCEMNLSEQQLIERALWVFDALYARVRAA